jgi:hypothetical protein
MTGRGPKPLAASCDDALTVDAPSTAGVPAVHLVLVHALCAAVDAQLAAATPVPVPAPQPPAAVNRNGRGLHTGDLGELTG